MGGPLDTKGGAYFFPKNVCSVDGAEKKVFSPQTLKYIHKRKKCSCLVLEIKKIVCQKRKQYRNQWSAPKGRILIENLERPRIDKQANR